MINKFLIAAGVIGVGVVAFGALTAYAVYKDVAKHRPQLNWGGATA